MVCWHTKHRYFEKFVLAEFRHLSSYFKILAWANLHWCQNCLNHKLLQQDMVCWHTKHRYFEKFVLAKFRHLSSYFKILAWANLHWCQNCLNHKLLQQEMVCWHTKHRYFGKCVLAQFRLLLSYFKILARANLHCCLLNGIIDIHILLLLFSHDVPPTHPSLPVPWAHWETKSQRQHALLTGIWGKLNVPLTLAVYWILWFQDYF